MSWGRGGGGFVEKKNRVEWWRKVVFEKKEHNG